MINRALHPLAAFILFTIDLGAQRLFDHACLHDLKPRILHEYLAEWMVVFFDDEAGLR